MIVRSLNRWRGLWVYLGLIVFAITKIYSAEVSALTSRGYAILPEPQQVELKGGDFVFGDGWRLELGSGVKADDVAVESLKEGLLRRSTAPDTSTAA